MSTSSTDLHDLSLAQLAAKLKAREVSSVEAAQHFLARAKAQSDLGAFVHINEDVTLAQAKAADAAIADSATADRMAPMASCSSRRHCSSSPATPGAPSARAWMARLS